MARVPNLNVNDLPEHYQGDFNRLSGIFSGFTNQVPVYALCPAGMKQIFETTLALRETGNFPKRLMEIAVIAASHANRCEYCVTHHSAILTGLGLDADTVSDITRAEPVKLSELELLVRDYAIAVSERAWGLRDDMFERLREHFSNEQIVELTMRIALTGMFNTINQALDIELEEGMITMPLAEGLEETG
jgi:uncharacterized peroxidase-related enzyme